METEAYNGSNRKGAAIPGLPHRVRQRRMGAAAMASRRRGQSAGGSRA
jgi:hypothetical protein